jgi:hypothetical protein
MPELATLSTSVADLHQVTLRFGFHPVPKTTSSLFVSTFGDLLIDLCLFEGGPKDIGFEFDLITFLAEPKVIRGRDVGESSQDNEGQRDQTETNQAIKAYPGSRCASLLGAYPRRCRLRGAFTPLTLPGLFG